MVLVAYAGPVRPAAALRASVLCLPTDIHSLFVNKPSSSSSSSSSFTASALNKLSSSSSSSSQFTALALNKPSSSSSSSFFSTTQPSQ